MLAKTLNYRVASSKLNISEPALSKQIHSLENSINIKLFIKKGRNIDLTSDGIKVFTNVTKVLKELDNFNNQIAIINRSDKNNLTLNIGLSGNKYIYKYLYLLKNTYPEVKINIEEIKSSLIISKIKNKELDFGITYVPINDSEISNDFMLNDELIAVSSSFGKYKNLIDISLKDLSNLPIAVLSRDYAIRKVIDEYFYNELLTPNYQFELNNYQSCLNTIKNTDTITLLPKTFLRYENLENFNVIRLKDKLEPLKVFGMHLKRNKFNSCLNYLLKIIEKNICNQNFNERSKYRHYK